MRNNLFKQLLMVAFVGLAAIGQLQAQKPDSTLTAANKAHPTPKTGNLAPTPPMGFNTWNTFQTNISEDMLRAAVDKFVASGMRDAGYKYFVLDDGWMAMDRDANGSLVADPKKFPGGMKAFADYVHSKGLKFGIYNCAGTRTCGGYPGTHGHEYEDARLYASWGVDLLKYDWCNTDSINARDAYKTMSLALQATGRPILFSLCEWGQHQPWLWARGIGEMYRSTGDIGASFAEDKRIGDWTPLSVLHILDQQLAIRQYNYPNHWNDLDMLEVGNGMTYTEDKAHFSLWCMMAAPLMAGNDLRKMSPQTAAILTNRAAIAVDQDSAGIAAFRYYAFDGLEMWVKPLSNGDVAVCFLNRSSHPQMMDYVWNAHRITESTSHADFNFASGRPYSIKNLWTGKNAGTTGKAFKEVIPAHDVVMLRLVKSR